MDVTDKWQSMTTSEYAALEIALGARLIATRNMWWRRVRPCFYRPLLPYCELSPGEVRPPLASLLGGVQHIVPAGVPANSHINLLLFDTPQAYSLESLRAGSRYHIRRAMRSFSVRPIVRLDEFISQGYAVYLSFYERTHYSYKKERTDRRHFAEWACTIFRFPKVRIYGAYHGEELASVSISYLVEEVLYTATFFSKSEALDEYVSDLMLHAIRERAAASENVRMIFAAHAGMERGLDEFYLRRGAKLVSKPARVTMNPLALKFLKTFRKDRYGKLGIETHEGYHE
jgi:hypothetical protein